MTRYGFIYDQAKCIGCNVCQMACKDKNNLEMGLFFRRAETLEIPAGEQPQFFHFSGACIHCDDAECIAHCPTGAMYRRADGTVGHRKEKCIGCGICTKVCPQAAPKLSVRDGRSSKCDGCFDLRRQADAQVVAYHFEVIENIRISFLNIQSRKRDFNILDRRNVGMNDFTLHLSFAFLLAGIRS